MCQAGDSKYETLKEQIKTEILRSTEISKNQYSLVDMCKPADLELIGNKRVGMKGRGWAYFFLKIHDNFKNFESSNRT